MNTEFNHEAEEVQDAVGVNVQDLESKVKKVAETFMNDESKSNNSHLTEMLEDNLSKRELAVIATEQVLGVLQEAMMQQNPLAQLMRLIASSRQG